MLSRKIGPVFEQIPNPLVVDTVGPLRLDQIAQGKLHQKIPERSRVEDAGIVDDYWPSHVSSPCLVLEPA